MDNPTLTLVDNSTVPDDDGTEGRGSNRQQVDEGAWLIDACDLEGVEAEEVEEDGVATAEGLIENQGTWATAQIGTSPGGNNDDNRDNNQQVAFEFLSCSECEARDRRSRPVKEICGHVKCRTCYISSEDGCRQCINMAELVTMDQTGSGQGLTSEGGNLNPEQEEDEGVKRIVVRPNEFILELGESSGNRSIAVVSSETLKELGIPHPDQESIGDDGNDKEPETENSQNEAEDPVPVTSNPVEDTTDVSNNPEPVPENVSPLSKVLKKKLLTDHVISLDGGSHKYKCTKCEKEFSQDYQRKYHAYCDPENGRRPYVCQICLQEFISQSHFLYHERSKHTGEKPYECQICFKRFLQKVKLNRHMTFHTSKPEKLEEASTYICGYCRKRFSSLSSCRRHIRNHTEDRAFTCPTCDKAFKQKYALDVHIKTHLNERPYKCPDCERAFSNAKDMRRHYLCHTGELPFQCQFGDCNAKFRRKDNLERHIRKMHKLPDKTARILGNEAAKQYLQSQSQKHKNAGTARRGQSNADDIADVITGI